jgi:hypothetical protein
MPTDTPVPVPAIDHSRYCVLSLEQVDDLEDHAHRLELYGALVWNDLDSYAVQDFHLEGLHALVGLMLEHVQGIEQLLEQGEHAAKGGA